MLSFTEIFIIYNPNSTGNSVQAAQQLQRELTKRLLNVKAKLVQTRYAGHAEVLAAELTGSHQRPLLISASGDGGYNEVVNGALAATTKQHRPICAVLAAGNANDHARTTQANPLIESVVAGETKQLDLLQLTVEAPGDAISKRYAHSYIGLGLTPAVAVELNKYSLNSWLELWSVVKTFWQLRPVTISVDGHKQRLDSLICSVIPEMAKVLKLSDQADPADGKFELVTLPHNHKIRLFYSLLKGVVRHMDAQPRAARYRFTILSDTPLQLDGEVQRLKAKAFVTISVVPAGLTTLA